MTEISRFFLKEYISIIPLTLQEILDETITHRLA